MAGGASEHIDTMLAAARRRGVRRGLLALAGACVLLATVWALVIPGSTLANATFCGQEEHGHSDDCYQLVLTCGFDAASAEGSADGDDGAGSDSDASEGSSAGLLGSDASDAADDASAADSEEAGGEVDGSFLEQGALPSSAAEGSSADAPGGEVLAADADGSVDLASETDVSGDAVVVGSVPDAVAAELSGSGSSVSSTGHVHSEACYKRVLACELSEHEHSLACYSNVSADIESEEDWEATLPADDDYTGEWAHDVLAVAESQLGYAESSANYEVGTNASGVEVAKGYTRYGAWYGDAYGDWCAMFASFCLYYAGVDVGLGGMPIDANCQSWIEALSAEGVGLWRPVEVVEDADGAAVRTGAAVVPAEVVADCEAEATEAAGEADDASVSGVASGAAVGGLDESGSSASDESAVRYTALGSLVYDPQLGDLVFFDWNYDGVADHVGFVYELLDAEGELVAGADIASSSDGGASSDIESADEASSGDASTDGAAGEEGDDDAETSADAEVAGSLASADGLAVKLRTIEGNVSDGSVDAVCYREYDSADSSILGYAALPETSEVQVAGLSLEEESSSAQEAAMKSNDGLSIVKGADTRDFVEINLYDYGTNINKKYEESRNYPGFQQDGGSKNVGTSFSKWSSFNFGNNITEDLVAGKSDVTNKGGAINVTAGSETEYGNANTPISGAISKALKDGYPALADGTSLGYLFSEGSYASKKNKNSVNGLFKYDEVSGAYSFNSRENHAQFDASSDSFKLYEQIITSNFMMYPFGNFLPFNNIETQCAQASSIDKDYLQSVAERARSKYKNGKGDEYGTLYEQLVKFISLMDEAHPEGWTAADCANEYFKAAGLDKTFSNDDLSSVYSIDYDEPTDFFFGMEMKMSFMQPKGGMTGKDNGDNEKEIDGETNARPGDPDGLSDYPMEFYFTGDDDVWVYIDGVLFLDLSGIHRHVGGKIDFVNGVVEYYGLDISTGDVSADPYKTVKFSDLVSSDQLNENGTFKDYSTHSFNFYYMERGAGSGVCRMNFNFPLLKQNSISVSKEIDSDTKVLGDPDYRFQILKANSDVDKTEDLFIGAGVEYTVYDTNDNKICVGITSDNGVFTLKAGQRAEFAGIDENAGKYYVRELFDGSTFEQYGTVTVSGEATTTSGNVEVGDETFIGMDSPVKDMSDGSTAFRFTNEVDADELASLSITKDLEEYVQARTAKAFDIEVRLDDSFLPVGTKYEVASEASDDKARTGAVETAGIITIHAGEIATIGGILAGTKFTVQETSASAKGYTVTYSGKDISTSGGSASGTVGVSSSISVTVKNSENGTSVSIPVTKTISKSDGSEHAFDFKLVEVADKSGETIVPDGKKLETSLTVDSSGSTSASSAFVLSYLEGGISTLPATYYYKISECVDSSRQDTVLFDETAYVAEVKVSVVGGEIAARVSGVYKDGETVWTPDSDEEIAPASGEGFASAISFSNTLLGSLEVSKTVVGTATDQDFTFEIVLDKGSSEVEPLPEFFNAKIYHKGDSSAASAEEVVLKLVDGRLMRDNSASGSNGESGADGSDADDAGIIGDAGADSGSDENDVRSDTSITLKDGERIVVDGIPYGTAWKVTETNANGFEVSHEVTAVGGGAASSGEDVESDANDDAQAGVSDSGNDANASEADGSDDSSDAIAKDAGKTASGSIVVGGTAVAFTNIQLYQLPETGGVGTVVCVLAGLVLVGVALAGMRLLHRRKGVG